MFLSGGSKKVDKYIKILFKWLLQFLCRQQEECIFLFFFFTKKIYAFFVVRKMWLKPGEGDFCFYEIKKNFIQTREKRRLITWLLEDTWLTSSASPLCVKNSRMAIFINDQCVLTKAMNEQSNKLFLMKQII